MTAKLFTPMTIRGVTWKNRVMVSPMWQYAGEGGFPTDWHLMNLGRLADGGAGLVFQEGTTVERRGCGTPGDLGMWDDKYVEPLQRLVRLIRSNGGTPAIQLMHTGRKARQKAPWQGRGALERTPDIADWDDWELIAPSAIPAGEGLPMPREMTAADIAAVIQAFGDAARRSRDAGYDVIELHGAHGYLLHQFLSPASNVRGDRYGGSFDNRIRFVEEVVEATRAEWPEDKPLFLRLSCIDNAGWDMADTIALTRRLMPMGVDLIDCSSGGLTGSPLPAGQVASYGYQVPYAAELKRETGVATAAVGLIVHAEQAERILEQGEADMVAIGRELIYNPNWPIDAAQKLGVDPSFAVTQRRTGFWLDRRAATVPGLKPSTYAGVETR